MSSAPSLTPLPSDQAPSSKPTNRELRAMIRMLIIPSAISVVMILARLAYTSELGFRFLLWNLFLAWIPLALALAICRLPQSKRLSLVCLFTAWLLFFPNSFYIATDMIHTNRIGAHGFFRWYDMLMTGCFAASGAFLGSVSLYLLHSLVRGRFGSYAGWAFAGTILGLASFGIYLGRFLRFNSWNVVTKPHVLLDGIVSLIGSKSMEVVAFCGAFSLFSVLVYGFVFSAVHLRDSATTSRLAE